MSDNANAQNQNSDQPAFDIVRIYAKDCSLETPNVPGVFTKSGSLKSRLILMQNSEHRRRQLRSRFKSYCNLHFR